MQNIYYCPACGKFHFSQEQSTLPLFEACPHCFNFYSVNTDYQKESYDQMDGDAKTALKEEIKSKFTPAYIDELKELQLKQEKEAKGIVYEINGARGRHITVFKDRCVINTTVTAGSIITGNATDGEKTIFYKDVIGIQFKESGMSLGYLQLETASRQMNNENSNFFGENTFTFVETTENMNEVKEYIVSQVAKHKQCAYPLVQDLNTIASLYEKGLLDAHEYQSLKTKLLS